MLQSKYGQHVGTCSMQQSSCSKHDDQSCSRALMLLLLCSMEPARGHAYTILHPICTVTQVKLVVLGSGPIICHPLHPFACVEAPGSDVCACIQLQLIKASLRPSRRVSNLCHPLHPGKAGPRLRQGLVLRELDVCAKVHAGAGRASGRGTGGRHRGCQGRRYVQVGLLGVPHAVLDEAAQVRRPLDARHLLLDGLVRDCSCHLRTDTKRCITAVSITSKLN